MKAKFDVRELSNAVTVMNKIQSETGRVPQLIFFTFSDNLAEMYSTKNMYSTNWEVKVKAKIECEKEGDDREVAVYKKDLLNIINEVKKTSKFVTIEIDGIYMIIKSGDNKVFKLMTETDTEFGIFEPSDIPLHQFSPKEFAEALEHVIHAAPKKNNLSRAVDAIHIVDGKIFYCCDYFRLAKYELEKPLGITDKTHITSKTAKFLIEAINVLEKDSGKIGVKDGIMAIEIENYRIEVMCADYLITEEVFELVLAREWENIVSIETKEFANALKQIKKASRNEYVYIETSHDNPNVIKLSSCDKYGNTNMSMEIDAMIDKPVDSKKAFNTQFLIDAIKPVRDKYVKLYYPSNGDDCVDIFANDEKYRMMIMEVEIVLS